MSEESLQGCLKLGAAINFVKKLLLYSDVVSFTVTLAHCD